MARSSEAVIGHCRTPAYKEVLAQARVNPEPKPGEDSAAVSTTPVPALEEEELGLEVEEHHGRRTDMTTIIDDHPTLDEPDLDFGERPPKLLLPIAVGNMIFQKNADPPVMVMTQIPNMTSSFPWWREAPWTELF